MMVDMDVVRWVRVGLLQTVSVVLSVCIAVACNQVLNGGVWNWWWTLAAVALTGAGAFVTFLLARRPTAAPGSDSPSPGQMVSGTSASGIQQVAEVRGDVILGGGRVGRRTASSPGPEPVPAGDEEPEAGSQNVRNSRVDGTIMQVYGVDGDLEIGGS
ncbi:hypothetical protein [Nonomuraea sp. NPDC049784]|uniref:hypothetical protein n=1 Tax=Nonomuraea sp. NPDC049784 TaxID=3154361 RepID=UPI0033CDE090